VVDYSFSGCAFNIYISMLTMLLTAILYRDAIRRIIAERSP
jgi:hypothetical protein